MKTHTLALALALLLVSAAARSAAPPPRPILVPKPAISADQVRGWDAVGKVLVGAHAMRKARAICGEGMPFAVGPDQLGEIVATAVGQPLAEIESGSAAPGWYEFIAGQRVAKIAGGDTCDADTASFVASELDGFVEMPLADLRSLKDLGKVPAARWPEFTLAQREHQNLALGQFNELSSTMAVADEVARRCPASKARVDAFMARADAASVRLTGVRVSESIARQRADANAAHMNQNVRDIAAGLISDAGGCGTPRFDEWVADTDVTLTALEAKLAPTPPLPPGWAQGLK